MSRDFRETINRVDADVAAFRALVPDTVKAFGGLARSALAAGALDRKTKELIALAISVSVRCDACVAYHARGAARQGAAREEVAEALGVAVQMGGGPALNYAASALAAFDQLGAAEAGAPSGIGLRSGGAGAS